MNASAETPVVLRAPDAFASASLLTLLDFDGDLPAFWDLFLKAVASSLPARRLVLLRSYAGQPWHAFHQWPADTSGDADEARRIIQQLSRIPQDLRPGPVEVDHTGLPSLHEGAFTVVFAPLPASPNTASAMVVVLNADAVGAEALPIGLSPLLTLLADLPARWAMTSAGRTPPMSRPWSGSVGALTEAQSAAPPTHDFSVAQRLHDILQSCIRLGEETRFMKLAFSLCNDIAGRLEADRVSLGWIDGHYVKLMAMSQIEKFDRKSALARSLESAMEEAVDQEAVLVYPGPAGTSSGFVVRAHETYAQDANVVALTSVPIGRGDVIEAVLTVESSRGALTEAQLWELRMLTQGVARALVDLRDRDRFWGIRLWEGLRKNAEGLLGAQHTGWKLLGASALLFLLATLVIPWSYRVDAAIAIRSKDLIFMPAPFDGYLKAAYVDVGDSVRPGDLLVELDTRDLTLEASMAQAEMLRYTREAEKALATRNLAEMQISLARQQQAEARLGLIRFQLDNARVLAPYAGVVVEGELKKNLGSPVRKGDLLLKLTQSDETYLELEIDQSDIHEITKGTSGEFALVGRPEQKFQLVIDRIDPVAVTQEGRNVYLARAVVQDPPADWWRPGMAGTAKLDAGDHSLLWVMTHRTVRFLREMFWI
ncbi:MAG: HlyD family efflux transporter periplasmic adaptor subunit [Burkholderiaceae bacterium]